MTDSNQGDRPLTETALSKAQTAVDDVAQLLLMEEQTRRNEVIIRKHENHKMDVVTKEVRFFRRLASRFPRLYYITTQLFAPLLILIGMAFLFGWGLATLESVGEIENNDAAFQAVLNDYVAYLEERYLIHDSIMNAPGECLAQYDNSTVLNGLISTKEHADILSDLLNCSTMSAQEEFIIQDFFTFLLGSSPELSFNWIDCDRADLGNETEPSDHVLQFVQYLMDFFVDFTYHVNATDTGDGAGDLELAIKLSSGSQSCDPHIAGGALFWFTIMTTIGYGNTAPETQGGRLLVLTCGFVTIIGFLALNSTASNILLAIIDDILIRLRLRQLTKGLKAVIFWLCLLILWMLVLALIVKSWIQRRQGANMPLSDAYWFSYITTTTVGFGDLHIPHEEFQARDMFTIPLVVLFAFVILGNFASKLVECFMAWFPADLTLESLLEASRSEGNEEDKWVPPAKQIERRHSL